MFFKRWKTRYFTLSGGSISYNKSNAVSRTLDFTFLHIRNMAVCLRSFSLRHDLVCHSSWRVSASHVPVSKRQCSCLTFLFKKRHGLSLGSILFINYFLTAKKDKKRCFNDPIIVNLPLEFRPATLIWHKIWMNVRKNLNIQKRIWIWLPKKHFFLNRNLYQFKAKKIWILNQVYLNFSKFQQKKIWMIQIKSEWMAGLWIYL